MQVGNPICKFSIFYKLKELQENYPIEFIATFAHFLIHFSARTWQKEFFRLIKDFKKETLNVYK